MADLSAIQQAIEGALSDRFDDRIQIAEVQRFPYSQVYRCALRRSQCGGAPETVIVRVPREGTARAGSTGLDTERAALECLASFASPCGPHVFAGSARSGFLVTEDLGTHPCLLDILLGLDAEEAAQSIRAFARGLGQMHALTAQAVGRLPTVVVPIAEHWRQVKDASAQLGLPDPRSADADVEAIIVRLKTPQNFLALSSGDPSVVNCKIADYKVRFFDFEAACFRSALSDAAVLRFLYPTGGPPWRAPGQIMDQAEAVYRQEFSTAYPEIEDDALYEPGMAAAVAAWVIVRLTRLPKVDSGPDRDPWMLLPSNWSGPTPERSRRRQLISIVETGIDSARRARSIRAFADWSERLLDVLRRRWPEASEELPAYPAFR